MGLLTTSFAMATSLKWAIVCYGVEVTNLVSTFDLWVVLRWQWRLRRVVGKQVVYGGFDWGYEQQNCCSSPPIYHCHCWRYFDSIWAGKLDMWNDLIRNLSKNTVRYYI